MAWTACAVTVLAVLMMALAAEEPSGGFYATRYDHIDIETILNHKRLVTYYAKCMLGSGPCTPQGSEFKRILPEALQTNCRRCTEKQHVVTMRTIRRLIKEYPNVWAELSSQWDPTGQHLRKFEDTYNAIYGRNPNAPISGNPSATIPAENPNSISTTSRYVRVTQQTPTTMTTTSTSASVTSQGTVRVSPLVLRNSFEQPTSTARVIRTDTNYPKPTTTNRPIIVNTTPVNRATTIFTIFRPIPDPKLSKLAQKLLACYSLLCTLLLGVKCY